MSVTVYVSLSVALYTRRWKTLKKMQHNVGIAEWQKVGKQGREDSINTWDIFFHNTCIMKKDLGAIYWTVLCWTVSMLSYFPMFCHSAIPTLILCYNSNDCLVYATSLRYYPGAGWKWPQTAISSVTSPAVESHTRHGRADIAITIITIQCSTVHRTEVNCSHSIQKNLPS